MTVQDHLNMLDWDEVAEHFHRRLNTHILLKKALADPKKYCALALFGDANYSASEHDLGSAIVATNTNIETQIAGLVASMKTTKPDDIPTLVGQAAIKYLKIGVGSELSMMLYPDKFWVTNIRTLWVHLFIKYDDVDTANEMLDLYHAGDGGEIPYKFWPALHTGTGSRMLDVLRLSEPEAKKRKIDCTKYKYLWVDAVCSALYASRDEE